MVDAVTPTAQKPKHHITLSDGTTVVGLIAVKAGTNKDGEIVTTQDENAIDINPSQPLAIQTSQGDSAYSDREWPYMTLVQDDWSGGRGSETFEDDRARYFDGHRVDTWNEGALLLEYQNLDGFAEQVAVIGGTVSEIAFSSDGTNYFVTGLTSGVFLVGHTEKLKVTYTVEPVMTALPVK